MAESHNHSQDAFTFNTREDGFCEICLKDELQPGITPALAQQLQKHIEAHGIPPGLLLDARRSAPLSMVRLSNLVDTLSQPNMRLVVVFVDKQQQELANLLHHTLVHRELIAYFTNVDKAWAFLTGESPEA
ncbi:MAG: hypothetical protein JXJ20_08935 [Anaerolineae bacterium]|jgi:hypothetical protein|nr:hypothetical protein [Anaerolineae bacterium]